MMILDECDFLEDVFGRHDTLVMSPTMYATWRRAWAPPRAQLVLGSGNRAPQGPVPAKTNKRAKVKAARKAAHRNRK